VLLNEGEGFYTICRFEAGISIGFQPMFQQPPEVGLIFHQDTGPMLGRRRRGEA